MYLLGLFNGHEKAEEMKILSINNKNSKNFVIHISRPKLYISQTKYQFKHENIYPFFRQTQKCNSYVFQSEMPSSTVFSPNLKYLCVYRYLIFKEYKIGKSIELTVE